MLERFEDLLGQIIIKVKEEDNNKIIFTLQNGEEYILHHHQDCCERVQIEDINGNLNDLVGTPILLAEEITNNNSTLEYGIGMWTFYKLATIKGYAHIRWYGTSNGYYSVRVSFDNRKDWY
jgi:hypothetical protein